jgi:N-acetylmuramoyl-L-alanine amidase
MSLCTLPDAGKGGDLAVGKVRGISDSRGRMIARFLFRLMVLGLTLWLGGCAGTVKDTSRSFSCVVIDAGHGGHDNGARSRYSGREKDLALDVAMRLQPKLKAAGFETVMTRSNDRFISLDDRARISNRQRNALFVSVHFNYSPNSGAQGAEVYYKSPCSAKTARNILNQIVAIRGTNSRGVKTANFRVLEKAEYPAVLVECGFLTNRYEGRRCASGAYREALAAAIARGLLIQRYGGVQMMALQPAPTVAPMAGVVAPN